MESFNDAFQMVLNYCRDELSQVSYAQWIKDIQPLRFEDSTAYLGVRSDFIKDLIEKKYRKLIESSFERVFGFEVKAVFISDDTTRPAPVPVPQYHQPERVQGGSFVQPACETGGGDYEYTFSTFIVGSSNKFAHAASQAVASNPAGAYNPLFIYGASGLGKTHLLYAICAEIRQTKPHMKILYTRGEEFTNDLINAISTETTKQFHDKYRSADVLLIDDIQFIGGKESTQEEFFHTFNTLHQAEKQIVLTSDRPPKEIKTLEERLRTRFEWGLIADVQAPDFETRIAIIRRKAELLQIQIPDEVSEYIANRLKNNIRQLEGVVKKLKAYKLLTNTPPTILSAQTAIRDILNDNQPVPVTIERIIAEVGRTYGIQPKDIRSNKRSAAISGARQISIYIVRQITQMSMAAIGEEFGGRDHSTIVYATQQVEKLMEKDSRVKETVEDIIKNIRDN